MSLYSVLFTVIVLGVGAYFGVLRPTTEKNKGRLNRRPLL